MAQSLASVIVHIIFGTKHREPMIHPAIEEELYRYIATICRSHGCPVYKIGGMADHIHILCSFGRMVTISKLVEAIKVSSSKWMKTKGILNFQWQKGYGIFSIRESGLPRVVRYIERQKLHHQKKTFDEEYRKFLSSYHVEFDERYVLD